MEKKDQMKKRPGFMRKRIRKAHGKAEFVGMLYFFASLILATLAFFTTVEGTSVGGMNVTNFWKPLLELKNLKKSPLAISLNAAIAMMYLLMLLIVVINVFYSLSKLGKLFKRRASKTNGFNRNSMAMEDLGRAFSVVFSSLIVFPFAMYLFTDGTANLTAIYYIAIVLGTLVHFWGGLVGCNVSLFVISDTVSEEKRRYGRLAPFFRNLVQFVFVGLLMYWIAESNVILNLLYWGKAGAFKQMTKVAIVENGLIPAGQLVICLLTVILLKHATGINEYDRDGQDGAGMKVFRVTSFILFLVAGMMFGGMFIVHKKAPAFVPSMATLYIAVIALAAFVEEICMRKLPNFNAWGVEQIEGSEEVELDPDEPVDPTLFEEKTEETTETAPVQYVTQPVWVMQPNGQPMLMPMLIAQNAGEQVQPQMQMQAPVYPYAYPYAPYMQYGYNPYLLAGRPYDPYHYVPEQETVSESVEEKAEEPAPKYTPAYTPPAEAAAEKVEREEKLTAKQRKENLAAAKKELKAEAKILRKEKKFEDERAEVERALAAKWMKKASEPVVEEPVVEEKANAPVVEETALVPVTATETAPVEEKAVEPEVKEASMETYSYEQSKFNHPMATDLSEDDLSKPLPPMKWQVTCPECAIKLTVKEGSFAYRCPTCGSVFQLRKVFRAKQKQENE